MAATPEPPAMMACTEGLRGAMSLLNALSQGHNHRVSKGQQKKKKKEMMKRMWKLEGEAHLHTSQ